MISALVSVRPATGRSSTARKVSQSSTVMVEVVWLISKLPPNKSNGNGETAEQSRRNTSDVFTCRNSTNSNQPQHVDLESSLVDLSLLPHAAKPKGA